MKHALVTGAGGFIGWQLCERLREAGVTVTALHRRSRPGPWSAEILCDLGAAAPGPGELAGIDTVFHLAGHAHAEDVPGSAELHRRTSVEGTARLLSALGERPVRLVYASSVKAMGESTPVDGVDESTPPAPVTAYGRARLEAERLLLDAGSARAVTVLRLPLVYGAGSRGNLQRMLRATDAGRLPLLPDFGNRRSMIHVDDVCAAALGCVDVAATGGRVYLLGDGHRGGGGYGTREIQCLIHEALGRPLPAWSIPRWSLTAAARLGDAARALGVRRVPFDSTALSRLSGSACYRSARAQIEFGFAPRWTLRDGLDGMVVELRAGRA